MQSTPFPYIWNDADREALLGKDNLSLKIINWCVLRTQKILRNTFLNYVNAFVINNFIDKRLFNKKTIS